MMKFCNVEFHLQYVLESLVSDFWNMSVQRGYCLWWMQVIWAGRATNSTVLLKLRPPDCVAEEELGLTWAWIDAIMNPEVWERWHDFVSLVVVLLMSKHSKKFFLELWDMTQSEEIKIIYWRTRKKIRGFGWKLCSMFWALKQMELIELTASVGFAEQHKEMAGGFFTWRCPSLALPGCRSCNSLHLA